MSKDRLERYRAWGQLGAKAWQACFRSAEARAQLHERDAKRLAAEVERLQAANRRAVAALRELREFAAIPDDVADDEDWLVSSRHVQAVVNRALGQ